MAQSHPELTSFAGQVIKGYALRELIGQGGFGVVYRAYQTIVDREVALKIILPLYANNPTFIRRFETEARLIAKLDHIHIVPLYDYWREPDSTCLVMRWLRGGSLQAALERNGPLEIPMVAKQLDQIAAALAVAHRNGVIHRDIKPANILLDEENNVYLADFGIAKILSADAQNIPENDHYGSPDYISPEQVTGQPISPQTDIYSLGVVLYTMLTGTRPFSDPSTTTVIRRHVYEPLPPLQDHRSDLPHALNIVIWRATSKQPEARYPDVLSLAADFRRVISSEQESSKILLGPTPVPTRTLSQPANRTLDLNTVFEPQNPYKGLRAFEEADADDFFGRRQVIERLVHRLSEDGEGSRFLAVVGPSGSGKSSVVKAGLLPMLRQGILFGSRDWFIVEMVPGADPFIELEAALLKVALNAPEAIAEKLRTQASSLPGIVQSMLPESDAELVLVIDQFEEVFTQPADETSRARFLDLLAAAVTEPDSRLRIMITLRADFYDRPLLYPAFARLIQERTEIIVPLSLKEMEQAIVGPAEHQGLRFEPELVATILEEVHQQPGALPLLQYALTELFEHREGFNLTHAAYNAIGGVSGALGRRAEELYQRLDADGQEMVHQLFLRLISPDEGDDTRRRVLQTELYSLTPDRQKLQKIIDDFCAYRLLTTDHEPITRAPTLEIAHEALIRVWSRLQDWLDASQQELRIHRRLTLAASTWIDSGRDGSFLATGTQLTQFEQLLQHKLIALNDSETRYLQTSLAARQRAIRRVRLFIAGLVLLTAAAVGLALFAFDRQSAAEAERNRADLQARVSRSRELAITALAGETQTDLALLLSLEALQAADTFEARNSLLLTLQSQPHLARFLHADAPIRSLAFSPDGRFLLSGDLNNQMRLWDAQTGQALGQPANHHSGRINDVAFSPDGTIAASASADGSVGLWQMMADNPSLELIGKPLTGHTDAVWSVAFHPSGDWLASGGADGQIIFWDTHTGQVIGQSLKSDSSTVYDLAFSSDGQWLASAGDNSTVQLWQITRDQTWLAQPVGDPLTGHNNWILALAFSPDGHTLASSGADAQIIFWDVAARQRLAAINSGHNNWVRSLSFSPDGNLLVSASQDHTLRLWDVLTGEMLGDPLAAHADAVWSAAFRPDGNILASGGADDKIIFWNPQAEPALGQILGVHDDPVLAVAYQPNGQQVASAGGNPAGTETDDSIRLWDAQTGTPLHRLQAHSRYVTALVYSPDGTLLASASADQTIRLWNSATGELIQTWTNPGGAKPLVLAFSPGGDRLASGDERGAIVFWHPANPDQPGDSYPIYPNDVLSLAFDPRGQTLAVGGRDGTLVFCHLGEKVTCGQPVPAHKEAVSALAYSRTERILASGSADNTFILWDADTRQPLSQPLNVQDEIASIAFSPDGSLLALGSLDTTVSLWDVTNRQRLGLPFTGQQDWITDVTFSPDGQKLVSSSVDKTVLIWDVSLPSWQKHACQIASRNLTSQEWEQYFTGIPYHSPCPTPSP